MFPRIKCISALAPGWNGPSLSPFQRSRFNTAAIDWITSERPKDLSNPHISSIKLSDGSDCESIEFHRVWLRHHCRCSACFNPVTHQRRRAPPGSIFQDSQILGLEANPSTDSVRIRWNDSHESEFRMSWLKKSLPKQETRTFPGVPFPRHDPTPLENDKMASPLETAISYSDITRRDDALRQLLTNLVKTGFGVVSQVPPTIGSTQEVIDRISHPHRSFYGDGVGVATADLQHKDTAYTPEPLSVHTDSSYFTEPMGLQLFHLLYHDGTGGRNSFADGFRSARLLHKESPEMYAALSSIPVLSEYIDPGKYHYSSLGLTIGHDLVSGDIERIRFNPMDMGTQSHIHPRNLTLFYKSLVRFSELLDQSTIWVQPSPGTVILIDNWRVLHGRTQFTGRRSMAWAYLPRSDWMSKARVLGAVVA